MRDDRDERTANRLIEEKLGWAPRGTLTEGLAKTYRWISEQVDKARSR